MSSAPKRGRYGALAIATAQFYNTTGTVPSQLQLAPDISYLITTQPSCTIVVCELPSGCSEQELLGLFSRFGQVKNAKVVCGGRAALVEFCDISTPTRLVHMAKTNPFFVGTSMVRLEFSSETITTPSESKVINEKPATTSEPTRILHLDIAAADYPITVDVIKAICSPHGQLQRIFIGKKNLDRSLEALVEFQSIEEAKTVKQQLDGADIYSGCCSLTVTYSQIPKIHVTKNDSESWDFTGPNASVQGPLNNSSNQRTLLSIASTNTGNTLSSPLMPAPMPNVPAPAPCVQPTYAPPAPSYPSHIGPSAPGAPMGYYAMPSYMPPPPHAPPPVYGQMPPHPGMYNAPTPYMGYNVPVQRPAPPQPPTQHTFPVSSKVVILPTPPSTHPVSATGIGLGHATSNLNSSSSARPTDVSVFESMEGVVLMACNLPTHLNCDHLFNLLCLYGNIARIKFLKTRPGCAMIQVGTAEAADLIHRYYDSLTIFDRTIQFYHSKQPELTEHENLGVLDDGSPVMKNYMNDPNNRFRNVIVASRSRILEPSRTLHFFNTPLYITPDDVATVFTNAGVKCPPRIVIFTAKHGQKTSLGLVEWDTLSEALEALVLMNHYPVHVSGVSHPFHMKLAFSPKPISSDRVGQSLIRYPAPPLTTMSRERSHAPPVLETESASTAEDESASVDKRKSVEADKSNMHGANGTNNSNTPSQQQQEQEKSAYGDTSAPHPNGNHPGDNPCSGSLESPTASQNTSPGDSNPTSRNADVSQINHSVTGGYSPPASSDNDSSGSAN